MKRIHKIASMLVSIIMLMQIFAITSFAEDVNTFPPVRPGVGNMKVAVSSGRGNNIAGLRTNGTINIREELIQGLSFITDESKNQLLSLTNVVDVACSTYNVAALKDDGTVYVSIGRVGDFGNVAMWNDIVAISAGTDHIVGLKADGTVVAAGDNSYGQCDVMGWNHVSKIYAHYNTTLAIRKDGTVLATGVIDNYSELRKQTNVADVFCKKSLDGTCSFEVLKNDGTVSVTEQASVREEGIIGYGGESKELSINEILQIIDYTGKIVSFKIAGHGYSYSTKYIFLDEAGDLYQLSLSQDIHWTRKKLEENIVGFTVDDKNYYAWDERGQIYSDALAFTSADWILTTNITYDGKRIASDVPPYVKDGRTLAPIRAILETLGMTVSWDGNTQTATAVKADITISVTINSNIAIVNGEQKTLDVPAEITNGRTFVPVRFFAEALNMNVDWDSYTKTVLIESK